MNTLTWLISMDLFMEVHIPVLYSPMDPMGLVITGLKKPSRVWQHLPPQGRGEIIESSSCQLVIWDRSTQESSHVFFLGSPLLKTSK